ncbi:hypothetical protein AVEN_225612-1 [Araneus ventricosus]|uniref:Uncharacterized protein n=1 Tax=Araneus ventricosus TaxID=182803 RepID=A0A4Y2EXY2_ARAVE|nr:hypothetical protein AVEN_225612-1 [Araneus ventricosus]
MEENKKLMTRKKQTGYLTPQHTPELGARAAPCRFGNRILMEESEDDYSGSFQQEMEAAEVDTRMKPYHSYVCGIQEDHGGEFDTTAFRTSNLVKSKFVLVVKDKFFISGSQLNAELPDCIFQVDCRK